MSHPAPGSRSRDVAGGGTAGPRLVTLPAAPASVPLARRLVSRALAELDEDLRDRAEACISELVTNAVLHARTEVHVGVETSPDVVRLEVRDRSTGMPRRLVHTVRSATGRGMEMVGLLARSWGVELLDDGSKAVWCELDAATGGPVGDALDPDTILAAWPDGDELLLGPGRAEAVPVVHGQAVGDPADGGERPAVVLVGYPVRLGIRGREHSSGVLRECALLTQGVEGAAPQGLLALAQRMAAGHGGDIATVEAQRTTALLRGDDTIDLRLPSSSASTEMLQAWQDAMDQLDAYAQTAALLSLATPPRLVELRRWMTREMTRQADGLPPRPWSGPLD
ncbi:MULTISPECIES: ATP-binding protein [unclassified Actinotalea]|uniref:ATP-binding protein n=1 Tax=unclassified Actinotalea TaxID=2638618 RepID=UPI0015F73C67|nr:MULTISPECIES: ATP-binding protein [unclassified Actinotalea]